jgi:hypothetical protein
LLVSMDPPMRVLTAASLSIDLIRRPAFGDPHAEAWLIIDHPKKGLQFRTRSATEEIVSIEVTWYHTLRRAMRATMKTSSFKGTSAKHAKKIDFSILPQLEVEFLERLSHWQHLLVSARATSEYGWRCTDVSVLFGRCLVCSCQKTWSPPPRT